MPFEHADTLAWLRDLYKLSQSAGARGPQRLAELMLDYVMAGFAAPKGCLAMQVDLARPEMTVVASRGDTEHPVGSLVRAEGNLLGHAIGACKPVASGDLPEAQREADCACGQGGSVLCWPLTMDREVIGALCVRREEGQPPLGAEDIERGATLTAFLSVIIDNARLHQEQRQGIEELSRANAEVQAINRRLEDAQNQLLQSEKMASIGQLAAGVAHEINNPIGYVHSNLGSLETYVEDVFRILEAYADVERRNPAQAALFAEVAGLRERLDVDFLKQDVHALLAETREGLGRVKKIVQDLKDFSRAGAEDEWHWADIHMGLDSTLNIVNNEIKYKAKVVKEYGELPEIKCLPSQLNQVFMNLLVNAAHAIEGQGTITVRTGTEGDNIWVEIGDTGCGISPENLPRIFEPFFTTKPVGKGTGLGLSLSYSIVQKHGGKIAVSSEPGRGTSFRITLPRERMTEAV